MLTVAQIAARVEQACVGLHATLEGVVKREGFFEVFLIIHTTVSKRSKTIYYWFDGTVSNFPPTASAFVKTHKNAISGTLTEVLVSK